jgi:hypothetical protein
MSWLESHKIVKDCNPKRVLIPVDKENHGNIWAYNFS